MLISVSTSKICPCCLYEFDYTPEFFNKESKRPSGLSYLCKTCQRAKNKAYRDSPEGQRQRRASRFVHVYGITIDEYEQMFEDQEGVCAICSQACYTGNFLAIDHDHQTGKVRGLLCSRCNTSIGKFEDSPDLLRKAIMYLESPRVAVAA